MHLAQRCQTDAAMHQLSGLIDKGCRESPSCAARRGIPTLIFTCALLIWSATAQAQESHYYVGVTLAPASKTITIVTEALPNDECRSALRKRRSEYATCLRVDVAKSILRRVFGTKAAESLN